MELLHKDKKEILKFLKKHKLMSLGTYYKKPWAAPVYYVFDNDLNIYFVSDPDTIHCHNISKENNVSVTIFDSKQKLSDDKVGLQLRGKTKKVVNVFKTKTILADWNKRHLDSPKLTYKKLTKVWKYRLYVIKPSYVKYYNEKLYKDDEMKDWKL